MKPCIVVIYLKLKSYGIRPFNDFSSPKEFPYQNILAFNYFFIFISSYMLLQIARSSHINMSRTSVSTNRHQCGCLLLYCLVLLLIPWSSKTQFGYQLLQEAHSSTIFLYTDDVVTSLIHAMTYFCRCKYCFTRYPSVYLSFYFTRLYFWREVIIFYL